MAQEYFRIRNNFKIVFYLHSGICEANIRNPDVVYNLAKANVQ